MAKIIFLIAAAVLLTVDGNCQVKARISSDEYLSQLTPDKLNEQLAIHKKLIYFDIGALAIGTTCIIGGINLLEKAEEEQLTLEGAVDFTFEQIFGFILLTTGIICDLCGIVLLPINLSQISKINKILENSEVKLGLMVYPPGSIYSNSFITPAPGVRITIRF